MLALAKLRCVKTGGSGARCFAASPFGLPGVCSEVTGGRSVPLPQLWVGEPLAPFRRNGEQGGGGAPGPPKAETGRGRLPPPTAAPEVTRP